MKNLHTSVSVRREIRAMKTTITEKQVNDRIQLVVFLSIAGTVIALITLAALFFGVNFN